MFLFILTKYFIKIIGTIIKNNYRYIILWPIIKKYKRIYTHSQTLININYSFLSSRIFAIITWHVHASSKEYDDMARVEGLPWMVERHRVSSISRRRVMRGCYRGWTNGKIDVRVAVISVGSTKKHEHHWENVNV